MEVGLLFGGRIELRPEWAVFLCGHSFLAVFMADLVVEALGKPYNHPFWLHGSVVLEGTCLKGVIEPAIAHVGVATYVKWQPKGQRSPSAIFRSRECL